MHPLFKPCKPPKTHSCSILPWPACTCFEVPHQPNRIREYPDVQKSMTNISFDGARLAKHKPPPPSETDCLLASFRKLRTEHFAVSSPMYHLSKTICCCIFTWTCIHCSSICVLYAVLFEQEEDGWRWFQFSAVSQSSAK